MWVSRFVHKSKKKTFSPSQEERLLLLNNLEYEIIAEYALKILNKSGS